MQTLPVQDLAEFVGAHAQPPVLLLDVREDWEVALAPLQVAGAQTRHIPMGQVPGRLAELDPAQPIVAFCHHGVRSAQVVAFLVHQGRGPVYNLTGGIDAWSIQVDPRVPRY